LRAVYLRAVQIVGGARSMRLIVGETNCGVQKTLAIYYRRN
jgi:hypothetical protein